MRLARSAGVSPQAVEIQRSKIRRKVEVREKPQVADPVDLALANVHDRTALAYGGVPHGTASPPQQQTNGNFRRTSEWLTGQALRDSFSPPVEDSGISRMLTIPYHVIEDVFGHQATRGATEAQILDAFIGPVRRGFTRQIDRDIMRQQFQIYETVDRSDPPPNFIARGQYRREHLDSEVIRRGRHPVSLETGQPDWNAILRMPPEMQVIEVEEEPNRYRYAITFRSTEDLLL